MAAVHASQGNLHEALRYYQSASEVTGETRGAKALRWGLLYGQGATLEGLGNSAQTPESSAQYWRQACLAYEESVRLLTEMRSELRTSPLGTYEALFLEAGSTQRVYERLVGLLVRMGEVDWAWAYLQRARSSTLAESLRQLNSPIPGHPPGRLSETELPEFESVRKSIPPGVSIASYLPLEHELLIFVASRDSGVRCRKVEVGRDSLGEYVAEFRRWVQRRSANPTEATEEPGGFVYAGPDPSEREESFRIATQELYEYLISPIWDDVKTADVLLIQPYGSLHYLPFAALSHGAVSGEPRYLLEDLPVAYLHELTPDTFGATPATGLEEPAVWCGIADPIGDLGHAKQEVELIAGLLPASRVWIRKGPDASRPQLFEMPQHTGVIHFATHGMVNAEDLGGVLAATRAFCTVR